MAVTLLFPKSGQSLDLASVRQAEAERIGVIEQAARAAVCVIDADGLSGGSGVLIDAEGYGITNFHVIAEMLEGNPGEGALGDGRRHPIEVLGIDPTGDVAMFKLKGDGPFPAATLGDSDAVRVGDPVYAIGNPFMLAEDFTPTVTAGLVSGTGRYQFGSDTRSLVYTDCIQIDASINPGNSGGPLFDAAGRLIGINGRASFERRGRVNVGIAYAVSINQIKRFLPGLRRGLLVEHGGLGATFVDAGYRQIITQRIAVGSVAEKAGLQAGDRLLRFAGQPIRTANQYLNVLGTFPAGWSVEVVWEHEGATRQQTIELEPLQVKLPAKLSQRYRTDIEVTRQAAKDSPQALPPSPDEWLMPTTASAASRADLARGVNRGIVKLYGGKIGSEVGYAAGVIVSEDGHVVTALSLLLDARELRAVTYDGHIYRCEVVYRDAYRQLALLRMSRRSENVDTAASRRAQMTPPEWRPLPVGASKDLQPGDWLFVVGNPFKIAEGDEPVSMMCGVLSGQASMSAERGFEPVAYQGPVLLLDLVSSNPGAPGSAVVDNQGRWVGLVGESVTSRLTHTDLNYAYPIEEVAQFLEDAKTGQATSAPAAARAGPPGFHGVRLSKLAYHRRLPFVRSVVADSPAAQAGVRPDDLIVSANGVAIPSADAFTELCERLRAGDNLALIVKRGGDVYTLRFTLAEPKKNEPADEPR